MNRVEWCFAVAFMAVSSSASAAGIEEMYQRDMDRVRIKHVDDLISLTVEYSFKTGRLPLADRLQGKAVEVFVTHRPISPALLEQAAKLPIVLLSADELKDDLEKGLGRTIDLPSDPQNFATYAPNLYIYHVDPTHACIAAHLYGAAPGARGVGTYYKYERCIINNKGADAALTPDEERYQRDADIFRARHLIEWAKLVEEYYAKSGHYPLQRRAEGDQIVLVQIATREQQSYLDPANPKYVRKMDNKGPPYTTISVKELVQELEGVLGREIEERYDPQREPNGATPTYLSYSVDRNGYLIWTACQTCPGSSNSFSALLSGGMPTINIGSTWFVNNVRKTQSIASLQANEEYIAFVGKGPTRPERFEQLERAQVHESKDSDQVHKSTNSYADWYEAGRTKRSQGDLDGAIAAYSHAIELNPNLSPAYNNRGSAKTAKNDLDGAIADFTRAIELEPRNVKAWGNRAEARSRTGNVKGAIADLTEVIELSPGLAYAYEARGKLYLAEGDAEAAYGDATRAVDLDSKNADAWNLRGETRGMKHEYTWAVADFSKAIELAPTVPLGYFNRGVAEQAIGKLDVAISDYTKAVERDPSYVAAYVKRGVARALKGDDTGAIDDYSSAIGREPNSVQAYENRGYIYLKLERFELAIADLSKALALAPDNPAALFNRANAYFRRGDYTAAAADFDQAILLDPRYGDAYLGRGMARAALGRYDLATSDLDQAIRFGPRRAEAHAAQGEVHVRLGQSDRALRDFADAIQLDPNLVDVYKRRAELYHALKLDVLAVQDLEKTVTLTPGDAGARNNLAWLLATGAPASVRNGKRAVEMALEGCALSTPRDPDCSDTLAASYAEAGNFEKAVELQLKAIANAGSSADLAMRERLRLYRAGQTVPTD